MGEYIERESIKKSINSLLDMVLKFTHSPIEIKQLVFDVIDEERAANVQPVKWISVKDRLPDDCVELLVYDTDCGIVIGWYNKKDDIFVAEFMNELDAVTHWMPLPEPPKDGDTNK